jgi:Na+-driven multidrug efflux pump
VAGAGVAAVGAAGVGTLILLGYLLSGRSLVRLALRAGGFRRGLFWEILRVGAPGSLNTVLTNLTAVLLTGLVAPFGTGAVAGYGLASRLEYVLIPLVFGLGAGVTGAIGLLAALFPHAWIGLFSAEPAVLEAGATYLRIVGPTYAFFGLGLALYFASQGAGRLFWPLAASFVRLLIAAGGGWLAVHALGGGLAGLSVAIATALVVFGSTITLAIKGGAWR